MDAAQGYGSVLRSRGLPGLLPAWRVAALHAAPGRGANECETLMNRPSFQFYPADWKGNSKLRRCSEAARGAWMDILCLLHDSDEYGVCRWPLAELARAAGIHINSAKELVKNGVLKGADFELADPYIYTPRSGRVDGPSITLIPSQNGPLWYSSRFVRDEYVRNNSGASTRFTSSPCRSPSRRHGVDQGDGSSSSSSASTKKDARARVKEANTSGQVPVFCDTPQWEAWKQARGGRLPVTDIRPENGGQIQRGWYFPTEFPTPPTQRTAK